MKIAKVVPQTRLPRGTNFFDYKVPDSLQNLKPGSFVKIPLRRQILSGIVFEIFETQVQPTYELKEIVEITENSLSANLLKLVRLSAEDIFVSPSIIIQAVVAEQPAKKQPSRKILAPPALIPLKFKPEQIEPLVRSFKEIQSTSGSILCHCPGDKEKKALIYKVIEAGLKEKKKIILISPTINQVNEWLGLLTPLAPESMSVLHGGQNKNTHWQNWQNIEQNIAQLVIGTRQAIFAPFGRVDEIIFDEAENDDLKQSDQNPRFDSRDVALNRAQIDSAKVIFFSQTPQISTYYLTESNPPQLKYISLPAQPLTSVKVLNLKDVETEIDFRLSRELLETTRECLLTNQRVFLLINQKGLASTLSCSDCFHAFICPHCRVTLAQEKDYLNCRLCQYQEPTPGFCPKCHG
ncbi:hypothetical protein HY224_00340, partial [Candidatus Uhrbacteria bacterium]|nr:hypothetical protein [Candidatus Uhrbacteria bacterium]